MIDEIQTYKALITMHKVLQEGHPSCLRDAIEHRDYIRLLTRVPVGAHPLRGYAPLIAEYVSYILAKITFHQRHDGFNGLFEYEEYITLKSTCDPNEGYETISDLMALQDHIDRMQKLVFALLRPVGGNECRIASLVPLVYESHGIYKFITSMLRAMHESEFFF